MWLGIDVLSELNRPVPPLECTCQTSWLPMTTERLRVTCAFMFSQNNYTSCVSVGRASFSVLCQPSHLNTLSTLLVTAVKGDQADSDSLKPTIHGTQREKKTHGPQSVNFCLILDLNVWVFLDSGVILVIDYSYSLHAQSTQGKWCQTDTSPHWHYRTRQHARQAGFEFQRFIKLCLLIADSA